MDLPDSIKRLIDTSKRSHEEKTSAGETEVIVVDEVAAKVASFYESIRGIVDWREEHILRKSAIERILKRRMLLRDGLLLNEEGKEIAEQFLKELVRGGHFPNNTIPVSKIEVIQNLINKYASILKKSSVQNYKEKTELETWFLQMVSYEIEITLDHHEKEMELNAFMAEDFLNRVKLREEDRKIISEDEVKLQIYVAVHRALFKMDDSVISFYLLERLYKDWHSPMESTLIHITSHMKEIKETIYKALKHPLGESFYKIAERYDAPYLILGDVIFENTASFMEIADDHDKLDVKIGEAYKARLSRLKGKVRRAAFYSTFSIFLTKVIIVLAIELPVDKYFKGSFNYTAIAISILIPPILMMFLVISAKITTNDNLKKVKVEVRNLISGIIKTQYYISLPSRKKYVRYFSSLFYFTNFLFSFGLIWWILRHLGFGYFSIFVFMFFISLVAFAGIKIQQRGRELMVGEIKPGFLSSLIDFLFLPVVKVGKWLSGYFVRWNAIIFIFNFLIETPIQVFVEFIEQWRTFLREKKEEIH